MRVEKRKRKIKIRGEEKVNDGCLTKSRLFKGKSTGLERGGDEREMSERERKHRKVGDICPTRKERTKLALNDNAARQQRREKIG